MNPGWTVERTEMLRTLIAEGLSFSQIAKRLGGISREAVGGKAWRMGFHQPAKASDPGARDLQQKLNATRRFGPAPRPVVALVPKPVGPESAAGPWAPLQGLPPVLRLHATGCKWPITVEGDELSWCCGAHRVLEAPYCLEHAELAYRQAGNGVKDPAKELIRSLRRYA